MAQKKPVVIDGLVTEVPVHSSIADVAPSTARSVVLSDGKLVHREDFARTPVPDGFEVNLSAINKGSAAGSSGLQTCSPNSEAEGQGHGHR